MGDRDIGTGTGKELWRYGTVFEAHRKSADVKSIVTLALTAVFACQAVRGEVSQDFMMIYTTVIAFYFGTQAQKLQSGAETRHDDGASE